MCDGHGLDSLAEVLHDTRVPRRLRALVGVATPTTGELLGHVSVVVAALVGLGDLTPSGDRTGEGADEVGAVDGDPNLRVEWS